MKGKYTRESAIKKCIDVHGNKYDYSLMDYVNTKTKFKIICEKHGVFEQSLYYHLLGRGCAKCGIMRKTADVFIEQSNLIHNNKYDYSLVDYVNGKTKVKIVCKKHGVFEQLPHNHLRSFCACKKCSDNKREKTYIDRCVDIHNNYYDYSNVIYNGYDNNILIVCPRHGKFEQQLSKHLNNRGCPKCALENASKRYRLSLDVFLERCEKVHGDRYDYSLVKYKNLHDKVKIICPIHSEFEQDAAYHLKGGGCPTCQESKGERKIRIFLQKLNIHFNPQYRISECRDTNPLPFDFYLPFKNVLIEYDGIQHFEVCERFGGVDGFKDRKRKDEIKNNYCKHNNIKLYRIKYNDNIKDKMNKIIKDIFLY